MDLVSDYQPIPMPYLDNDCGQGYYLLSNLIKVERLYSVDFPETRHSRLPLFFRNSLPFMTPPDSLAITSEIVSVSWKGKGLVFPESVVDDYSRSFRSGCTYHVPPASVMMYFSCCGMDQIYVEAKYGNKEFSFTFFKLPYLPILLLHPGDIVPPGDCATSTQNTDLIFSNRDSYSLYDMLMLIYHWRITCYDSVVDPISIFTQAIAEPEVAHNNFTLGCFKCTPSIVTTVMSTEIFSDLALRVGPWICNVPIEQMLAAYNVIQLGGVFVPFLGMMIAFQPMPNYWTLVYTEEPDNPVNFPPDFYLIHANLLVKSSCGDDHCYALIDYGTDFLPSLDCFSMSQLTVSSVSGDFSYASAPVEFDTGYGIYYRPGQTYYSTVTGTKIEYPGVVNDLVLNQLVSNTVRLFSGPWGVGEDYFSQSWQLYRTELIRQYSNMDQINISLGEPNYAVEVASVSDTNSEEAAFNLVVYTLNDPILAYKVFVDSRLAIRGLYPENEYRSYDAPYTLYLYDEITDSTIEVTLE